MGPTAASVARWATELEPVLAALDGGRLPDPATASAALTNATEAARRQLRAAAKVQSDALSSPKPAAAATVEAACRAKRRAADAARALDLLRPAERALFHPPASGAEEDADWRLLLPSLALWRKGRRRADDDVGFDGSMDGPLYVLYTAEEEDEDEDV